MKKRVTAFSIVLIAETATFLVGNLLIRNSWKISVDNELLLANNSLISRFGSEAEEKEAKPIGISKLSNDIGEQPELSGDGSRLLFYSPKTGQIRAFSNPGTDPHELLSSELIHVLKPGLTGLEWSASQKEAAGKDAKGFVYYNFDTNKSRSLPADVKTAKFMKNSSQPNSMNLVYLSIPPGSEKGGIYIANPAAGTRKKILNTRFGGWQVDTLVENRISLANSFNLFLLDPETGDLDKILEGKLSLDANWSPTGKKLLYSSGDELYFMDLADRKDINLNMAGKSSQCVWRRDETAVYCFNSESLFRINVSGQPQTETIAQNSFGLNVDGLIWLENSEMLVFRDTGSSKFYAFYINP